MRLAAGLRPDPLQEFKALSRTPRWILGVGTGKGQWGKEGRGKGKGRRRRNKKGGYGPGDIYLRDKRGRWSYCLWI